MAISMYVNGEWKEVGYVGEFTFKEEPYEYYNTDFKHITTTLEPKTISIPFENIGFAALKAAKSLNLFGETFNWNEKDEPPPLWEQG